MILTINGGSSSVKFAGYLAADLSRAFAGRIERVGTPDARLIADGQERKIEALRSGDAARAIVTHIEKRLGADAVTAIGHRVVHGGLRLLEHQLITPDVLEQLRQAVPMDRAHLPGEIELIEAFEREFPSRPQVACFDTAFFRNLPRVAQLLPIRASFLIRDCAGLDFTAFRTRI